GDGINYTDNFISDKLFDTLDEACEAAKEIAQSLGFVVVKGSKKLNDAGCELRIYMNCSRGPRCRSSSSDIRMAKSKKVDCQFRVVVRGKMVQGLCRFRIDGVRDTKYHNHNFARFLDVSRETNVFTDAEKEDIMTMSWSHTQPKNIRSQLNKKYEKHYCMNQIYNEIYKNRREKFNGINAMEWTLNAVAGLGYFVQCTRDDDNHVVNLLLCHPESIRMVAAWYFVILIDSTYKTNMYRKPMIQVVGVTPVRKNFSIGFALVENETTEMYIWLLEHLKVLLGKQHPDTFVIDKERALGAALAKIFPRSPHLLCVWHMKTNIEAKVKSLTRSDDAVEAFVRGTWNKILFASSIHEFEEAWEFMWSSRWGQIKTLMTYVTSEWLPCSMKWAHCYTNKVFHIGNTSTNRVESQHSSFKKWLNTSTSHVDTLFEAYHCSVEGQIIEVQKDLDESHAKICHTNLS
ncbi:PKS-NRPS hybrid synthetase cheA, partial [Linum grandiflorum]